MSSTGFWVAAGLALVVLLLAIHRPVLARMGIGYSLQRKRQTALVVAGLMVATTVLVAAGVAADSSARSFTESILGRVYLADAVARASGGTSFLPVEIAESPVHEPGLKDAIAAHAVALRMSLAAESTITGLGSKSIPVWGIDPTTYSRIARWETVEGRAPEDLSSWPPEGIVLNRDAAAAFGAALGDPVNAYLTDEEVVIPNTTLYAGRWEASFHVPVTGEYVHHPSDASRFNHTLNGSADQRGTVTFAVTAPPDIDFVLTVTDPGQKEVSNASQAGYAEVRFVQEYGGNHRYAIRVDSTRAVQTDFELNVTEDVRRILSEGTLEGTVLGIVETEGSDPLSRGPAVFVPLARMQEFLTVQDRVNVLLVDFKDVQNLEGVSDRFRRSVNELWKPAYAEIRTDRLSLERDRAEIELYVHATFLGIGSFSILAGFMLIGVLMALLVEERKHILATARALGAQRGDLVRMHLHEGSLYAALAAVAGIAGGGTLALLSMGHAQTLFAEEGARFVLVSKPGTVLSAAGWGFSLVLVVIAFAAYRATRLHLVTALRGEVDPPRRRSGSLALGIFVALLGGALLVSGFVGGNPWGKILGPALVALGATPFTSRHLGRGIGAGLPAGLLAAYLAATFRFMPVEEEADAILLPVRGLILACCLAVVAAYSGWVHRLVLGAFSLTPRIRPLFAVALGHLRTRPGRASLTISMFAVVLMVLTTLGTLFSSFETGDLGDGGGFEVLVDSKRPLGDPREYLRENPPAAQGNPLEQSAAYVATPWIDNGLGYLRKSFLWEGKEASTSPRVPRAPGVTQSAIVVTPEWADAIRLRASSLAPGYPDLKAAFHAVAKDPGLVVLSAGASYYDWGSRREIPVAVGDRLQAGRAGESYNLTVIGLVTGSGVAGAYLHPSAGEAMTKGWNLDGMGTRIWAQPKGDPRALAQSFESAFRRTGAEVTVVSEIAQEDKKVTDAIQAIISVFVGLGILIGMVSLALIMGRNVLLRRAEIGTMRAMGAPEEGILAMFSFEALYLTLWSIAIGLGVGLLLANATLRPDELSQSIRVDWGNLAALYGITLAGAVAAAFLPAWHASRLRPAQAVRYTE